jgi:hypothetical protein
MTTICGPDRRERARNALAAHGYSIVMDGGAGLIYYGYFAAPGKMADLAVEILGPRSESDWGNWQAEGGDEFWAILAGPTY